MCNISGLKIRKFGISVFLKWDPGTFIKREVFSSLLEILNFGFDHQLDCFDAQKTANKPTKFGMIWGIRRT